MLKGMADARILPLVGFDGFYDQTKDSFNKNKPSQNRKGIASLALVLLIAHLQVVEGLNMNSMGLSWEQKHSYCFCECFEYTSFDCLAIFRS